MTEKQKQRYLFRKNIFDRIFSFLALVLLSPLILVLSLIIFIDDPGRSPFYVQIRIGREERPFRLYKFRTMRAGAEKELEDLVPRNEMQGPVFKIRDDARITRPGRFLRKSGLDEIPQFLNVLKGDMAVVGPRPPLPREVALYTDEQKKRLAVKPGITCYWQVMPHRNEVLFDDWVALDLKYIEEQCHRVDWRIMCRTVSAMLRKQGE